MCQYLELNAQILLESQEIIIYDRETKLVTEVFCNG
jgi:hypothetical protein